MNIKRYKVVPPAPAEAWVAKSEDNGPFCFAKDVEREIERQAQEIDNLQQRIRNQATRIRTDQAVIDARRERDEANAKVQAQHNEIEKYANWEAWAIGRIKGLEDRAHSSTIKARMGRVERERDTLNQLNDSKAKQILEQRKEIDKLKGEINALDAMNDNQVEQIQERRREIKELKALTVGEYHELCSRCGRTVHPLMEQLEDERDEAVKEKEYACKQVEKAVAKAAFHERKAGLLREDRPRVCKDLLCAQRALQDAGFTYDEGAWKAPVNRRVLDRQRVEELRAQLKDAMEHGLVLQRYTVPVKEARESQIKAAREFFGAEREDD